MTKFCGKCGNEIDKSDEFCGNCGNIITKTAQGSNIIRTKQDYSPFNKKKNIIQSLYIALGSIFLYNSVNLFFITFRYNGDSYTVYFIFTLIAGMLLIIAYHGLLKNKKYSRIIGIFGCIFTILFIIFEFDLLFYEFTQYIILILTFILLILTLLYWKKLIQNNKTQELTK